MAGHGGRAKKVLQLVSPGEYASKKLAPKPVFKDLTELCPDDFSPKQRAKWEQFATSTAGMRITTKDDFDALRELSIWSCIFDECVQYFEGLKKKYPKDTANNIYTYSSETSSGSLIWRPRPEFSMMSEASQKCLNYYARFGLTPADRTRVNTHEKQLNPKEGTGDDEFT